MKIGEVSEQLGMPPSTIRYYEQVGLIERQHRVAGKRQFNNKAVFMLQFVQLAQAAGFTITETKSLLDTYAEDPSPGGMWKRFAETKRSGIQQQIKQLQQMDRILTKLIKCECDSLEQCVQSASKQNHAAGD